MRIYAIIENVPYGEYVHIVCAKSRKQAEKLVKLDSDGKIQEIKLIKEGKSPKLILKGGCRE